MFLSIPLIDVVVAPPDGILSQDRIFQPSTLVIEEVSLLIVLLRYLPLSTMAYVYFLSFLYVQ